MVWGKKSDLATFAVQLFSPGVHGAVDAVKSWS